jgi:hypothetical protein
VAVDLLFDLGGDAVPGGAVPLLFGEEPGVVFTEITLDATAYPVGAWTVQVVPVQSGGARAGLAWGRAAVAPGPRVGLPWGDFEGAALAGRARLPWGDFDGQRLGTDPILPWGRTAAQRPVAAELPWDRAEARSRPASGAWGRPGAATWRAGLPWDRAQAGGRRALAPWGAAARAGRGAELPWDRARGVGGQNLPLPDDPVVVGFTPGPGPVHLHFCVPVADDTLDLVLGRENCQARPRIPDGTAIGARSTYMQTYSIAAWRLSDMLPIDVERFTLQADADAYGWTIQIEGDEGLLTLLAPVAGEPATVRLRIDGADWDGVVQGLRRNRSFERNTATVTARSAGVLLDSPYSPEASYVNAVPVTATQIIGEALSGTGVSLDWQCTDWTVPAGVWSFRGTPLAVVRRVAESIGALVQSPRSGESIIVTPRYLLPPWTWAAELPDVTLALDAVVLEGYERADRPAYEGVYLSGQAQGVLALVKRAGTAPTLLMPIETDPLLTHLDATEQRGIARLGTAGPQATMTLSVSVLTGVGEPGVIDPGKLLLVPDPEGAWKGLVRGTVVRYDGIELSQTITVERHL